MKNPNYVHYINDHFPHENLFGYLARQIIQPKANILKHVNDFYETNMQGYDFVIGVHLRMGMDDGDWQWKMLQSDDGDSQKRMAVENTFICLSNTNGLPNLRSFNDLRDSICFLLGVISFSGILDCCNFVNISSKKSIRL